MTGLHRRNGGRGPRVSQALPPHPRLSVTCHGRDQQQRYKDAQAAAQRSLCDAKPSSPVQAKELRLPTRGRTEEPSWTGTGQPLLDCGHCRLSQHLQRVRERERHLPSQTARIARAGQNPSLLPESPMWVPGAQALGLPLAGFSGCSQESGAARTHTACLCICTSYTTTAALSRHPDQTCQSLRQNHTPKRSSNSQPPETRGHNQPLVLIADTLWANWFLSNRSRKGTPGKQVEEEQKRGRMQAVRCPWQWLGKGAGDTGRGHSCPRDQDSPGSAGHG